MGRNPAEGTGQRELLRLLRFQIDTALAYPTPRNVAAARQMVLEHPQALRTVHFRHNLGLRRWEWISDQGIYPIGQPHEVAGMPAMKGTIEPEITT